jgi:hypothetical protein
VRLKEDRRPANTIDTIHEHHKSGISLRHGPSRAGNLYPCAPARSCYDSGKEERTMIQPS